jgi:hypothetical protein
MALLPATVSVAGDDAKVIVFGGSLEGHWEPIYHAHVCQTAAYVVGRFISIYISRHGIFTRCLFEHTKWP